MKKIKILLLLFLILIIIPLLLTNNVNYVKNNDFIKLDDLGVVFRKIEHTPPPDFNSKKINNFKYFKKHILNFEFSK